MIAYFESLPQVSIFFKDGVRQDELDSIGKQLKDDSRVAKVVFVSKEEAFKRYTSWYKHDPLLLELVNADILPRSYDISTKRIDDLKPIAKQFANSPQVLNIVFLEDIVKGIKLWADAIRTIGFLVIVILAVVGVFVIATIIGFKISQKREEIEIMRLLSATNWYIRWPFLLEGMFYGVIGAFFGWLVASVGLVYATPYLQSFLGTIPLLPVQLAFLLVLLAAEVVVAMCLGALSSFLAVLRYLK